MTIHIRNIKLKRTISVTVYTKNNIAIITGCFSFSSPYFLIKTTVIRSSSRSGKSVRQPRLRSRISPRIKQCNTRALVPPYEPRRILAPDRDRSVPPSEIVTRMPRPGFSVAPPDGRATRTYPRRFLNGAIQ